MSNGRKVTGRVIQIPTSALPRMVLMTYQLPDAIREIAMKGSSTSLTSMSFSRHEGNDYSGSTSCFEDEVQKWLNLIRGAYLPTSERQHATRFKKTANAIFRCAIAERAFAHILVLPDVAACQAMKNLLSKLRRISSSHD